MFKVKKFTLIELIVVIAILTVLAGIVIPNIKDVKDDAKTAAFSGVLKNTQTAVDMYLVKNKSYPSDTQPKIGEPQQLNFSLLVPKYLREKPKQSGYYA